MATQPVLIGGEWIASASKRTFQATDPKTRKPIPDNYPVSDWAEVERAVDASAEAFDALLTVSLTDRVAFLESFADRIEARAEEIVALAAAESALPAEPRLAKVELPRTTNQLRQAAEAAREYSWSAPTIDTKANIRSMYGPIGPVCVFGPNNFPLAFNSVAGGDFAAAVAAGNPVLAKANSSHPGTTRLLAEEANVAARETGMPAAMVQLLYRLDHADGERLVAHPKVGATGYTGSRAAGLALKRAADLAGKPIYLELSSVNPVVVLPGALRERSDALAAEFTTSCLMGAGQFCTNPGLVLLLAGEETELFVRAVAERFESAPIGTLLGEGIEKSLSHSVASLIEAGAELVTGGEQGGGTGCSYRNTLLRVSGRHFVENPEALQAEAFGNESLFLVAADRGELARVLGALEGNLTGTVYSHSGAEDDEDYRTVEPLLRRAVGRLLNDKMPTGVAVSAAMNHGGPYPATGHPGFTAVGLPASISRFGALHCYDGIREDRLPPILRNANSSGTPWRFIDGAWTRGDAE